MHELGLSRNVVAIVSEHAAGKKVKRVKLSIGPRACVERESLAFCFELAAKGSVLEGAKLEMVDGEGDSFLIKEYETKEAA